jgi:aminopeptidase N
MKSWAEHEDQLSTTHPIQGTVPDTDATFLNFDGITYGKGSAVIQQLVSVIGPESFR